MGTAERQDGDGGESGWRSSELPGEVQVQVLELGCQSSNHRAQVTYFLLRPENGLNSVSHHFLINVVGKTIIPT